MSKFYWTVFLLTPASVPRLSGALIERGIGVEPWFTNSEQLTVSHFIGPASTPYVVRLTTDVELDDLNSFLKRMLVEMELPFFGFCLDSDSAITGCVNGGNLSAPQKKEELNE